MASATTKRTCAKCDKGAGTAMCYGCEQAFCTKHFIEHRQELSQQMDNIGQEHDVLRRDLTNEQATHPLLARINQWEQESITKIQTAAKSARSDLQQLLNRAKNNLKTSVSEMTEKLQSSRDSDDYTELDIKKWTNQLQEFRKMLDNPTTVNIDFENDTRSVVRLIKVNDKQSIGFFDQTSQLYELKNRLSPNFETSVSEKFIDTFGKIRLLEEGLVATCSNSSSDWSCICGIGQYSAGVNCTRFRIEQLGPNYSVFFGIISCLETMAKDIWNSRSCYGWWELDCSVVGGKRQKSNDRGTIQTGDEVTLMLDCDNRRIQLENHRTNRIVDMSVDLRLCAFPWKMFILLRGKDDCVRILH